MAASAYSHRRSMFGSSIAALIIVGAIAAGWRYLDMAKDRPLSEDAVLTANVVNIASTVPGRIVTLAVAETQKVAKGDLLFTVDPEPYRLAADQARADLRIAEATRDGQRRTIAAEQSNAAIAGEQITRARTNLALAEQTLARLTPLLPKGYVTAQQVDDARTARDDARTSLAQAVKQAEAADSLVSTLDASEALIRESLAVFESLGDVHEVAVQSQNLAHLLAMAGRLDEAADLARSLVDTIVGLGSPNLTMAFANTWMNILLRLGDPGRAAQLFGMRTALVSRALFGSASPPSSRSRIPDCAIR